jgi:hypothetical protein
MTTSSVERATAWASLSGARRDGGVEGRPC